MLKVTYKYSDPIFFFIIQTDLLRFLNFPFPYASSFSLAPCLRILVNST